MSSSRFAAAGPQLAFLKRIRALDARFPIRPQALRTQGRAGAVALSTPGRLEAQEALN